MAGGIKVISLSHTNTNGRTTDTSDKKRQHFFNAQSIMTYIRAKTEREIAVSNKLHDSVCILCRLSNINDYDRHDPNKLP